MREGIAIGSYDLADADAPGNQNRLALFEECFCECVHIPPTRGGICKASHRAFLGGGERGLCPNEVNFLYGSLYLFISILHSRGFSFSLKMPKYEASITENSFFLSTILSAETSEKEKSGSDAGRLESTR